MRAHILQHVSFEGPGFIEAWLQQTGYTISTTKFYDATPQLPAPSELDFIVVMGGPMSIHDETEYPWLIEEKQWLMHAIDAGVTALGICLGAQLLACTLGSCVYRNKYKEIGWFPIRAEETQTDALFQLHDAVNVLHWHGETFDLPDGAVCLASSQACRNQAFQWGESVVGVQFHMEVTHEAVQALVEQCRDELNGGAFVQSEAQILAAGFADYHSLHQMMHQLLMQMHEKVKNKHSY